MKRHYHVLMGMHGYMPDVNDMYHTQRDAEEGARRWAVTCREDGDHVRGSARAGYYDVGERAYIEITDCDMADCEDVCRAWRMAVERSREGD